MRSIVLSVVLVLAAAPRLTRAVPDVASASRIDAVTVHRTSARVTRVARVELEEGEARVLLAGLPDGLEDDSIRLEGKGSARARLLGVSVERVTGAHAAVAEARAAEERLEAMQEEDRALEDRGKVAQARQKFVEALRSTYSEERARNLAVRAVAVKEWAELTAFVERELAAASAEVRRANAGRRDAKRRMDAARADLEKLAAKRAETTKRVAVGVEAERAGVLELAVTYTVANAGWGPVWEARLDPAASKVELALYGSVWQRSGEDWTDVRLVRLSRQEGCVALPRPHGGEEPPGRGGEARAPRPRAGCARRRDRGEGAGGHDASGARGPRAPGRAHLGADGRAARGEGGGAALRGARAARRGGGRAGVAEAGRPAGPRSEPVRNSGACDRPADHSRRKNGGREHFPA
jgi:hypothetical protein